MIHQLASLEMRAYHETQAGHLPIESCRWIHADAHAAFQDYIIVWYRKVNVASVLHRHLEPKAQA